MIDDERQKCNNRNKSRLTKTPCIGIRQSEKRKKGILRYNIRTREKTMVLTLEQFLAADCIDAGIKRKKQKSTHEQEASWSRWGPTKTDDRSRVSELTTDPLAITLEELQEYGREACIEIGSTEEGIEVLSDEEEDLTELHNALMNARFAHVFDGEDFQGSFISEKDGAVWQLCFGSFVNPKTLITDREVIYKGITLAR